MNVIRGKSQKKPKSEAFTCAPEASRRPQEGENHCPRMKYGKSERCLYGGSGAVWGGSEKIPKTRESKGFI